MKDISTNEQSSKKNSIVLSFDEQDEFDFKPLTKGLGFHHTEKKQTTVRSSGVMSRSVSSARKSIPTTPALKSTPTQKLSTPNSLPQELKAFYESPAETTVTPPIPSLGLSSSSAMEKVTTVSHRPILNEEIQNAPRIIQLGAWLVDLVVIALFVVATMSALFFMLGLEFSAWKEVLLADRNYIVPLCLFGIYYILYFSILDLVGGVGKSLMGLKVVARVPGEKLSFLKTIVRSVVSLLSLGAFGLPHIVDFQGKLSDTEVVSE